MAALAMTEIDVLQAAFDSKKIKPRIQSIATQAPRSETYFWNM